MSDKKVALVTGASRGLGKAIAETLAKNYTVIGTATSEEGAKKISDCLKGNGRGVCMNVCDQAQVKAVLEDIIANEGAPEILVNNAGIAQDNVLLRMKDEQWDKVIETNLSAVFRLTKLCLKTMLKARWGRIVNISSVVGVMGNPGQANYVAAKAGLIGFTKVVAQEYAAYGITANCIAPGFIESDMTEALNEKQKETILNSIPIKRMGKPADIAATVLFLVSESSNYMTGQTLHVNGGMCMV